MYRDQACAGDRVSANSSPTWTCEQFPLAMEGGRDILCYDGVEKQCSILRENIIIAGLLGPTIQLPLGSLLFFSFFFWWNRAGNTIRSQLQSHSSAAYWIRNGQIPSYQKGNRTKNKLIFHLSGAAVHKVPCSIQRKDAAYSQKGRKRDPTTTANETSRPTTRSTSTHPFLQR